MNLKEKGGVYLFYFTLFFAFVFFLVLVYFQYFFWKNDFGLGRYLVPPYQKFSYLFFYVLRHYVQPYLISLGLAFIFLGFCLILNTFSKGAFFYKEEPYLGAFGIFVLGYPWCLYYLLGFFLVMLIFLFLYSFLYRKKERFSFYSFWLPFCLIFLILKLVLVF